MTDTNTGASTRFGAETQKQIADDQRRAHSAESGKINKSTIVVVTTINTGDHYSYMDANEQLREHTIKGKTIDRLPALLERTAGATTDTNSAYYILHPNNGVPTRIDERISIGEKATCLIVSYTVNKAVSEMHGSLSLALFSAVSDSDLTDIAAEYGIHAIAIVDADKAPDMIKSITKQIEELKIVNITNIDESDDAFDNTVIDYAALPGNPVHVISGAVRTFIKQSENGEVFAAIPNNGETNVKTDNQHSAPVDLEEDFDENEEVVDEQGEEDAVCDTDYFGYKAETLTVEQMSEALTALSYDLSEMEDDAIREAFETEQRVWLNEHSDADQEGESEDGDEPEEEEEEFDAVQYLASLLAAEQFDRSALKVLMHSQDLVVYKKDTEETLTARLLELVEGATEQEIVELLDVFVTVLQERGIECPTMQAAFASEDEEEDSSDEEDDAEEEDGDEEDTEEEVETESGMTADEVTDPLDFFTFTGGDLTHEQRLQAIEAMGENVEGLNIIQVMKAFNRIQAQTGMIVIDSDCDVASAAVVEADEVEADEVEAEEVETEEENSEDEVSALLSQYDEETLSYVADSLGIQIDECETPEEMVEAILDGGSEDDYAAVEALVEMHDVETDLDIGSMEWEDALMLVLPVLLGLEDSAEDSDEPVEDEDEDTAENAESLKFLKEVDRSNAIGPMLSVEMEQTLIINYTLTDGNTYAPIESELADIGGFNYRFPFNLGKPGKSPGAMHVPAQNLIEMIERIGTSRFLADPKTFDISSWAESMEKTLADEIASVLYADRIEDGADPQEAGLVVGDFIDEDELNEARDLGHIDPEQFDEMMGDHLPIASLYNARSTVRPVKVDNAYVALNLTVLNIAVPGFWGDLASTEISRLVQGAVNRVIGLADTIDNVSIYAGFTLESAALLSNDKLFNALATLREMKGVQSYSAADAAKFAEVEDVIELAASLDDRDLPISILSSGVADSTFENGGDLTVLIPCGGQDEESDEDEDGEE